MADSVIALSPKDLKVSDYFTPRNRAWMTKKDLDMGSIGPTIFNFKNWELGGRQRQGRRYLLARHKSLGGADHRVPLYRSPLLANEEVNFAGKGFWGAFSTWEDPPERAGCTLRPGGHLRPRRSFRCSTARLPMAA